MIKNVLFDIGKVLIRWEPLALARSFCPDLETAEKVARATYLDETWQELDKGTYSVAEVIDIVCGRQPETLHPYIRQAYRFGEFADILTETTELAKKLKKEGYELYFASNFSEKVYGVIERLGIGELFSGHAFSFEEKLVKPSAAFFERLLQKYGLRAEECVFLDDMPQNIAGAKSVGIHGFLYEENPDQAYAYIHSFDA